MKVGEECVALGGTFSSCTNGCRDDLRSESWTRWGDTNAAALVLGVGLVGDTSVVLALIFSFSTSEACLSILMFRSLDCKGCRIGEVAASASAPCRSSIAEMLSLPTSDPVQLFLFDWIMFRKPSLVMLPKVDDRDLLAAPFSFEDATEVGRSAKSDPNELREGVRITLVAIATVPSSS